MTTNADSGLALTLKDKLYGQHLVIEPVVKYVKDHWKGNPSKALALSFHGTPGTGKSYVSRIVAEHLFEEGMKSKYVHLISAIKDFPHEGKVALYMYKDKLRELIESGVKECDRTLFIFEEMHQMPPGLIDTLKPYLDFYDSLDGVDYRKATFFFLSNTAGNDIAEKTINHWRNNEDRGSIRFDEMEEVIRLSALNDKNSGMWHSELILKNLITAYIPFLPLERGHVKQCIRDSLVQKGNYRSENGVPDSKVQEIADQLRYYPEGVLLFSETGCKRVNEKTVFVMEEI